MQKKILPSYIPPRVVRARQGWFILWYEKNPAGELERFRKTFSLNRISNRSARADRARIILQEITQALAAGGYIYGGKQAEGAQFTPLGHALELALQIKLQSDSRDTRNSYRSVGKIFRQWIEVENIASWPVIRFRRREAMAFLDHVRLKRGVGERTYNNYLAMVGALFSELKAREYIPDNPFQNIPKLRPGKKGRRKFSTEDRRTVAAWIAAKDPGLFRAVLLSYYCFIRPNEMRQMQIGCIDLAGKVIRIPEEIAKVNKARTVTIPEMILPYFEDMAGQFPPSYFLFSRGLQPGRLPCGKNTFNLAHRRALEGLFKAGSINTLTGLSFYSWKDSGLTDMAENISILDLMKQAGHTDPKITMRYIHDRPAKKIRAIKRKIF